MSREAAIAGAEEYFDSGTFKTDLTRRVAIPTESQNPERKADLARYLEIEMRPALEALGFECRYLHHSKAKAPMLYGERIEADDLPTVLGYGHGDVIRGQDSVWKEGLSPWILTEVGDRYYGRGVVDNKGQHTIDLAALGAVLEIRGKLGFNAKWLIEMGEETGSPGLREICHDEKELLSADVLIGSDGPRLALDRPTIYLGTRGGFPVDIWIDAREGGHHSGNWGGLLSNPAIQLAHALATITTATGQIRIPEWKPKYIPNSVRHALADCDITPVPGDPVIDPEWGEPGFSAAEKVFGWCSFEILAMTAGNPDHPVNAVPPRAWARGQLRFVVGIDTKKILPALRRHLDEHGFPFVQIAQGRDEIFHASRLDPEHPWVQWAAASMERTSGQRPAILPNLGGSLPNDIFSDGLGLPTVWVPHSYPGCSQHAPNEHLPVSIAREGLQLMAGLYWDLGEPGTPKRT
jgi:acetylornithine deacetylase/succinyl-diaminopimelate desuccinylase-like protein